MYKYFLISFLLFFISCSGENGKIIHPDAEFLAKIESADFTISLNDESSSALSCKEDADIIKIIGNTEDVDSEYFLPEAGDVSVGSELIFIAIPQLFEIRAFDYNGEFRFKFGRTGRGPGEFQRLQSIDFDEETGKLIAVDAQEVEIYDVRNDTAVSIQSISIPTATFMNDACILNGGLFVNGITVVVLDSVGIESGKFAHLKGSFPIHKYNLESGEELFDFGEEYKSASGFVGFDAILSETKLHCNEASNVVVGMSAHFPLIIGYNPQTGEKKWSTGIQDFISPQREETLRGDEVLNMPKDYYDRMEGIADLNSEYILLQTNFRPLNPGNFKLSDVSTKPDLNQFERKTLLLNTATGEISLLSNELELTIYQDEQINISSPVNYENPDEGKTVVISGKKFSF